jgi:tight adherence protein C
MSWQAILLALILIFVGAAALVKAFLLLRRDDVSTRLKTFVEDAPGTPNAMRGALSLRTRELSGSLTNRLFLPIVRQMGNMLSHWAPAHKIEEMQRQLYIAGHPYKMGAREFYGMRLIILVVSVILTYLLVNQGQNPTLNIVMAIFIPLLGLLLPTTWLSSLVRKRKDEVRRSLPDALDMLSICVQAGLAFDQAMQRVSAQWETPLSGELGRVVSEIEMGVARRVALRNLADRLEVTELSSFVAVIIQSEQLGMSISETLHTQADQMRVERHFTAQEQARTIPVKMLIPLTFLIFPALMAILLAPAIPDLVSLFGNL